MTDNTFDDREVLQKFAEALAQDLMDLPLGEALAEIEQDLAESITTYGEVFRSDVAALASSIKKERLVNARAAYMADVLERTPSNKKSGLNRQALLEKIKEVFARQPAFENLQVAFRERNREVMADRELEAFLEDICELESRLAHKRGGS